jgi:hypothetical protein
MPPKDNDPPEGVDAASVLDTVLHHVALEAAERGDATEVVSQRTLELHQQTLSRIAELRRQLTPVQPIIKRAEPIARELQLLDRDALLAKLEALRHDAGVRYAHMELTNLSDDDLRRMLATLEPATER